MISNLNGLITSKGTSTDEVVRTIQALISAGYQGEELLEKIDEIYGVGARNNLLKTINHSIPTDRSTIVIDYPEIMPYEKAKIGDILIGSNGYIGQIMEISFDSQDLISSITVLGLVLSVISSSNIPKLLTVTYNELVNLRDNNELVPGQQYRIIDYEVSVKSSLTGISTESHPFDIIVFADTVNTLNENARACLHEGDNYYSLYNVNLSAWELKYSLDNDDKKFEWADTENGKGVIYWLKDDFNNECCYDFKQITFTRYKITSCTNVPDLVGWYSANAYDGPTGDGRVTIDNNDSINAFTFSAIVNGNVTDLSVNNIKYNGTLISCYNNKIERYTRTWDNEDDIQYALNNNVFISNSLTQFFINNLFKTNTCKNTICLRANNNIIEGPFKSNIIEDFYDNVIYSGNSNIIGRFHRNTVTNSLTENSIVKAEDNTIGSLVSSFLKSDFLKNVIGLNVRYLTTGTNFVGNSIGNSCSHILCGNYFQNNLINNNVNNINFLKQLSGVAANYICNNTFGNGLNYLNIVCGEGNSNNYIKNYIFMNGLAGSANSLLTITLDRGNLYGTFVSGDQ